MLEFIENGFNCEETCEEWLEIKYKKKKEANGNLVLGIKMDQLERRS